MAVITHKRPEPLFGIRIPRWKRTLDVVGGTLILVCASPVLILVAVYIKLISPSGPLIFKQKRVGLGGANFTMWKFRTMTWKANTDAHQEYMAALIRGNSSEQQGQIGCQAMLKLDDENPDIILLGTYLRKTCIDELPQLINVIRGDMSLVGPRPVIPYEADEYLRWNKGRFDVTPGMTGLWQVSGKNRLTFNEMIRLDIRYGREMSPKLDSLILLKTPLAVLGEIDAGFARRLKRLLSRRFSAKNAGHDAATRHGEESDTSDSSTIVNIDESAFPPRKAGDHPGLVTDPVDRSLQKTT